MEPTSPATVMPSATVGSRHTVLVETNTLSNRRRQSSASTTSISSASGKKRGRPSKHEKLQRDALRIQEMRRQVAEYDAKQLSKYGLLLPSSSPAAGGDPALPPSTSTLDGLDPTMAAAAAYAWNKENHLFEIEAPPPSVPVLRGKKSNKNMLDTDESAAFALHGNAVGAGSATDADYAVEMSMLLGKGVIETATGGAQQSYMTSSRAEDAQLWALCSKQSMMLAKQNDLLRYYKEQLDAAVQKIQFMSEQLEQQMQEHAQLLDRARLERQDLDQKLGKRDKDSG